ncbi:non-motor microtubule binding protein [Lithospermum erythrorhizon]|uniref:Non-motor microtubule binding protein n=1 Tax=Lithospermum erythrorhizon TaxID=34254 RepID=A0AAV3P4P0_LITER
MTTTSKSSVILPPSKTPQPNRSNASIFTKKSILTETSILKKDSILNKDSENEHPNIESICGLKALSSPLTKSGLKSKKSGSKKPDPNGTSMLVKNRIRERKFVVAKRGKKSDGLNQPKAVNLGCKCDKGDGKVIKCLCVAYESLRASHEEFFKNLGGVGVENELVQVGLGEVGDEKNEVLIRNDGIGKGCKAGSREEFFENRGEVCVENGFDQVDQLDLDAVGGVKNEGLIRNTGLGKGFDVKWEECKNVSENGEEGINEMGVSEITTSNDGEEFSKNRGVICVENDFDQVVRLNLGEVGDAKNEGLIQNAGPEKGCEEEYKNDPEIREEGTNEMSISAVKRSRDRLLEEARETVPEPGSGRVMHLVKAFEKMKMMSKLKTNESNEKERDNNCLKWALPGLHDAPEVPDTRLSSSSFCPSDLFLSSECLGLDPRRSSSLDSDRGRNSSETPGAFARRKWRKRQQLKTTAKPFKLRTEERGKCKKEEFMKKVEQMKEEEEKLRVPIAQGLPWTTDEPERLAKPPIKEATIPIDLVLYSDVRAEERADFDHQVAEKMNLIEQYRMERDRQQKLAEEEEIRRLRKELIPKAQSMPYFDRPFIPRPSEKQPTLPKEPKFHIPQYKKVKCIQQSWSDTYSYISTSDVSCL